MIQMPKDPKLSPGRLACFLLSLFLIGPSITAADVNIGHFFPDRELLIGESLLWTIRLRHPAEESYRLRITQVPGAEIHVDHRRIEYLPGGKIQVVYSLRVTPVSLEIPEVPSVVIFDERGQSKVWNGGPLRVLSVSGGSMDIRQPAVLLPPREERSSGAWPLFLVLTLLLAGSVLIMRRRWEKMPHQLYAKDLRKALSEIQKDRLPVQTWRLLRSHFIWRHNVDALTPAQLKETARGDGRLSAISDALAGLESWKYGGVSDSWDRESVERSVRSALDLLRERRPAAFLSFRRKK